MRGVGGPPRHQRSMNGVRRCSSDSSATPLKRNAAWSPGTTGSCLCMVSQSPCSSTSTAKLSYQTTSSMLFKRPVFSHQRSTGLVLHLREFFEMQSKSYNTTGGEPIVLRRWCGGCGRLRSQPILTARHGQLSHRIFLLSQSLVTFIQPTLEMKPIWQR